MKKFKRFWTAFLLRFRRKESYSDAILREKPVAYYPLGRDTNERK